MVVAYQSLFLVVGTKMKSSHRTASWMEAIWLQNDYFKYTLILLLRAHIPYYHIGPIKWTWMCFIPACSPKSQCGLGRGTCAPQLGWIWFVPLSTEASGKFNLRPVLLSRHLSFGGDWSWAHQGFWVGIPLGLLCIHELKCWESFEPWHAKQYPSGLRPLPCRKLLSLACFISDEHRQREISLPFLSGNAMLNQTFTHRDSHPCLNAGQMKSMCLLSRVARPHSSRRHWCEGVKCVPGVSSALFPMFSHPSQASVFVPILPMPQLEVRWLVSRGHS